ncbi:hypothetical protein KQI61_07640 [Anaerocolumna aminovalerica]|uniref:hypothetical protein n=1 Tax=Anaerocolumna aminovalerica TaxID=1527 RepID=UPI001C0EE695|nr:hypothetical protein [Anaerocolumna aminovalerica]MBU5332068.1 hypothetical protein [Anaerocolumna aminovalerica]
MNNICLNERNGQKNIISDIENFAFAWAGYYANKSNIFVNGVKYFVDIVFEGNIHFSDNTETGFGNWVIFKNCDNDTSIIFQKEKLSQLRNDNPLTEHLYCFSDETFGALTA